MGIWIKTPKWAGAVLCALLLPAATGASTLNVGHFPDTIDQWLDAWSTLGASASFPSRTRSGRWIDLDAETGLWLSIQAVGSEEQNALDLDDPQQLKTEIQTWLDREPTETEGEASS